MEVFTPMTVIVNMMDVIDENTPGYRRLDKLLENMGYTAPEIRDARFWGTKYLAKDCIIDICKDHFSDNIIIHTIYQAAVNQYNKTGFIYKEDINETSHASS